MSGFCCQFYKGSLMKVHYPKLYNMAHLLLCIFTASKGSNNYFYSVAETVVWPIPFLINMFTALKGSQFFFFISSLLQTYDTVVILHDACGKM